MSPRDEHPLEARIVSDGTPQGTRVEFEGRVLANVQHVTWDLDITDQHATATITLGMVEVDLQGHARMQAGPTPRGAR